MKIRDKEISFLKNEKEAFNWLLLYSKKLEPLAGTLLMMLTEFIKIPKETNAIAYTFFKRKKMTIALKHEAIEKLTAEEALFVIFHELMHNSLNHFTRQGIVQYAKKDRKLTNIIIDYYANKAATEMARINEETAGKAIAKAFGKEDGTSAGIFENEIRLLARKFECEEEINNKDLNKMTEEQLLKIFFESKKYKENEIIINKLNNSIHGDHEKFDEWIKSEAEDNGMDPDDLRNIITTKMNSDITQADKGTSGKGNDNFKRHLERSKKKNDILDTLKIKNLIGKKLRNEYKKTYSRISRRQDNLIIKKGKKKKKGGRLIVGVDVSGSVSESELREIWGIFNSFLKKNGELTIIYWSSCKIEKDKHVIEEVTSFKELENFEVKSSGGTVIETLFEYVENTYKDQDIDFINISDFYFYNYPEYPSCVKEVYNLATCKNGFKYAKENYPEANNRLIKIQEV